MKSNGIRITFTSISSFFQITGIVLLILGMPMVASAQVDIGVGTTQTQSVVTDYGGNLVIQPDSTSFGDGVLNIGQDIGTSLGYGTLNLTATGTINADFPAVGGNFSLVDIGQGAANGVNPTSSGTGTLNQSGGIFYGPETLVVGDGNGNGSYIITGGSFISPVNTGASHIFVGLTESSYSQNGSIGNLTIGGSATFSINSSAFLDVGRTEDDNPTYAGGTGTIDQTGGTANYAGAVFIGSEGAGTGTYNLSAGSANFTSGIFMVGSGATTDETNLGKTAVGLFNQSGGTFTTSGGTTFQLGVNGAGTYTLSGTGTGTFNGSIALAANTGSVGTINLNGGTLQIGGTNGISAGGGTAAFNLGGGTLQVTNSDLTTSVDVNLASGTTSIIDTTNDNVTFNGTFGGPGSFTKIGSHTMTIAGGGAIGSETSSFEVDGGTLVINSSGTTTEFGTLLIGTASGAGTLDVDSNFTFGSGDVGGIPVGYLRVGYNGTGNLNLSGTATLSLLPTDNLSQLNIGGGSASGSGTLTMTGGTLDLDTVTSGNYAYITVGRDGAHGVVNQSAGTTEMGGSAIIGLDGGTGTYNLTGGTFTSGTNWAGAHVYLGLNQGNTDTTLGTFNVSGTASFTMEPNSYFDIGTGNAGGTGGTGVFNQSGGTVTMNGGGFGIGDDAAGVAGSGSYNMSGGTLSVNSGYFIIGGGVGATGTFTQTSGRVISNVGVLLGNNTGSGTLNLDGGTFEVGGSNGISAGNGTVAFNMGGGTLEVIGSSLTTSVGVTLTGSTVSRINTNGFNATFNGEINNDSLNNSQFIKTGTGTLEFNGASNSISSFYVTGGTFAQTTGTLTAYEVGVGSGTGNTGTYTMSGGSLVFPAGSVPPIVGNPGTFASFRVGDFGGTGTFLQSGGIVTVNGALNVGNQGGQGFYKLSGGSLDLESGQSALGRTNGSSSGSTGEIDLSGSGQLNVDGTYEFIGSNWYGTTGTPGSGIVKQTGGSFTVANTATLYLTGNGFGTYDLNGGTLNIGGNSLVGVFGGENGTYSFNMGGGTLKVLGSSLTTDVAVTLTGSTSSTINTNGFDATFSGEINNDVLNNSQLIKTGGGTLELNGVSNTISSFYVNGGNFAQTTGTLTAYEVGVGSGTGNTGTYTMSGGSLVFPAGSVPSIVGNPGSFASFRVGDFGGTGTFLQSGGIVIVNGALNVGNQGGQGIYDLSGGALDLELGQSALGRTNGSSSGSTGSFNLSGTGQLNLDGTYQFVGSDWYNTTGTPGSGVINQTGGTITVANTAQLILTGYGSGTYNLDGGTLNIGGNSLVGVFGGENGTYNFNLGGGTIKVYQSDLSTNVNATLTGSTPSTVDTNGLNATFSGSLTGTGSLAKTGSGTLNLSSNSNTYSGGTSVLSGALIARNTTGSATGSGSLTVASGATIGGPGLIAPSSFNISGNVQVGNGPGVDTTSSFTLSNAGASLFSNATLQFNLGNAGQSNELHLGSGSIDFSATTISLTLNFNSSTAPDSLFTLIDNGTGTDIYSGLTLSGTDTHGYSIITGGLTLATNNGSYLYLNGGTIGVSEAVPEPGTWTLILLGLTGFFFLRRKNRRGPAPR